MINIKDNIYLSDKYFLFNSNNHKLLLKNNIKRLLICTEYIDTEILKDESLAKFLMENDIGMDVIFDTKNLIYQTRFKIKGTEEFSKIRDELRAQAIKTTPILKNLANFEGNILLVCNKMNKMSPVFCLIIENIKNNRSSNFILDALPESGKNMTHVQRTKNILKCYNMFMNSLEKV